MSVRNRIQPGDGDPRHGTLNGYKNHKCHCALCRAAWAKHHVQYMDAHPEQREKARLRERARRAA